ncbi:MAG: hypothetical protein CM1200mP30_07010 [Pseudomonadota bacterium]|nr:MAG: hypothetical protein CM1200mP30_07010 [Pseudomonadota bacterium]
MEGQEVPPKTGMLPGHFTILCVRILVICVNGFHNTGCVVSFRIFNYFSQIKVLDRKMVVTVFKCSTHRWKGRPTHRCPHPSLSLRVPLTARRTVNEHDRVIGLSRVKGGIAPILLAVILHKDLGDRSW